MRGFRFRSPGGDDSGPAAIKGVLAIIYVKVEGNNINQAIKKLKKKMEREGFFREIKKRRYYEKPSQKRRRQAMESLRRLRKKMKRRAG